MNRRTVNLLLLITGELMATLVLLDLRLVGVINWSWLWIAAPLWLPVGVIGLAFGALAAIERLG